MSHDGIVNIGNFDPVHFMYETETKSLYIQYTAGNKYVLGNLLKQFLALILIM